MRPRQRAERLADLRDSIVAALVKADQLEEIVPGIFLDRARVAADEAIERVSGA